MMCAFTYTHDRCTRFKQPQEIFEMQPIMVTYPLELVHLDFLTVGGKADDNRSVNLLIVTDHSTKYAQAYVTPKADSSSGCSNLVGKLSGALWMA